MHTAKSKALTKYIRLQQLMPWINYIRSNKRFQITG